MIWIEMRNYANGFPKIQINNPQAIGGQNVAFLASFSKPDVIFEQMSVMYLFALYSAASFTLVLLFFPTTTTSSEDRDEERKPQTGYAVAKILSSIPVSRGRPTDLVVYDICCLQDFGQHFGDHIRVPHLLTGIDLLIPQLRLLPGYSNSKDSNKVAVAFPTNVAYDAFHERFTEFLVIDIPKIFRDYSPYIITTKPRKGYLRGYHVVIVCDLALSARTLISCQELLTYMGAKEVSAYVTHAVFLNRSWERFLSNEHGFFQNRFTHFSHIWITDSCPATVEAMGRAPFEVLSLAPSIAEVLQMDRDE